MAQEFLMRIKGLESNTTQDEDEQGAKNVDDFLTFGVVEGNTISMDIPTMYDGDEDDALEEKEATEGEAQTR
jgi:hypothetical protein